MNIKTINRGWLKKQMMKGLVEAQCQYHYTDDYARDADANCGKDDGYKPAVFVERRLARYGTWTPEQAEAIRAEDATLAGKTVFQADDLTTSTGRCYQDLETGVISLHIYTGYCFTLRIKQAPKKARAVRKPAASKQAEFVSHLLGEVA